MELNHETIDTPPRDAASVVMLRDSAAGLEVLLMRRHTDSAVLGGAYVFPGGKVDAADTAPEIVALIVAIVAIHVTIYLVMRFSVVLAKILRPTGILVLTRIAGLLVAAIAVQLIADGVFGFIDAHG